MQKSAKIYLRFHWFNNVLRQVAKQVRKVQKVAKWVKCWKYAEIAKKCGNMQKELKVAKSAEICKKCEIYGLDLNFIKISLRFLMFRESSDFLLNFMWKRGNYYFLQKCNCSNHFQKIYIFIKILNFRKFHRNSWRNRYFHET